MVEYTTKYDPNDPRIPERFRSKFDIADCGHETFCWVWNAARYLPNRDYGRFKIDGTTKPAHRVIYEILHRVSVLRGVNVCHKCDNPPCVNINHLFLGTYQDNMDDMMQKGRQYRGVGEAKGSSILTECEVLEIRRLRATTTLCMREIAELFDVSAATVCLIVNRKEWMHI